MKSQSKPLVSIIIPSYNYGRYIGEAIESALAQTHRPFEVIVVDDGSTDDTPDRLRHYTGLLTVIRQHRRGVSAARNAGVAAANGRYIAFLDADDIWLPHKIETQVARFANDPQLGIVSCAAISVDAGGNPLGGEEHKRTVPACVEGRIAEAMLLHKPIVKLPSSLLLRADVFREVGGFDEQFRAYEDWELTFRIALRYRYSFVSEPLYYRRKDGIRSYEMAQELEAIVLRLLDKAFRIAGPEYQKLRRRSYAGAQMIVAQAFYAEGRYRECLTHMLRAISMHPAQCAGPIRFAAKLLFNHRASEAHREQQQQIAGQIDG